MTGPTPVRPDTEVSAEQVVREFLGRDVGRLLVFDPVARAGHDAEGVHQLRVVARHLRSELRVMSRVLDDREMRTLDRDLRWLGGALGARRDVDVLTALFASVADRDVPVPPEVTARLDARREREARRLATTLASRRYRVLVARLAALVVAPPTNAAGRERAVDVVAPGLVRVARRLFREVDGAGASPSTDALHLIRIRAKRCRYSCEIAGDLVPGASAAAKEFEKVQSLLGDVHDHVVAMAFLDATLGASVVPGARPDADATRADLAKSLGRLRSRWVAPLTRGRACLEPLLAAQTSSSTGSELPVE